MNLIYGLVKDLKVTNYICTMLYFFLFRRLKLKNLLHIPLYIVTDNCKGFNKNNVLVNKTKNL